MDMQTISRPALEAIFAEAGVPHQMTGSRYICTPAPTDTDEDWIVLDQRGMAEIRLGKAGFVLNTDPTLYEAMPDFFAYRLGEFNVVLTRDPSFYDRFVAATELARVRNLLVKEDRIKLFQSILYGSD